MGLGQPLAHYVDSHPPTIRLLRALSRGGWTDDDLDELCRAVEAPGALEAARAARELRESLDADDDATPAPPPAPH